MSNTKENNKRIAKNSLLLYVRMILTMGISLYTSRIILDVLGVEDFGIYNVVASMTTMFIFFQSSLSNATQRYINVALAQEKAENVRNVFAQSFTIHIILGVIVVLMGEIIGTWLIREKLIISPDRLQAAIYVFHFTILCVFFTILQVPFISGIIAKERMGIYAYIGIIEVCMKFVIVFILTFFKNLDSLILYAALLSLVSFIILSIFFYYCHKNFKEYRIKLYWNLPLIKEMSQFISYNLIGCIGWSIGYQGIEIMLNIFFGTIANAARGVANQVRNAVDRLTQNIIIAANPQITQLQASGKHNEMFLLVKRISKVTYFFMLIIATPAIIESHFLLSLWLKNVPQYAVLFTQLVLLDSFMSVLCSPWHTVIFATGKIRQICFIQTILMILGVLISYLLLKIGFPIATPLIISIFIQIIYLISHLIDAYRKIQYNVNEYIREVCYPIFFITILLVLPLIGLYKILDEGWIRFISIGIADILIGVTIIYLLGFTHVEQKYIKNIILDRLKRK